MDLTPDLLVEIEKIKQLKYAYLRTVDLKLWEEMAGLLTDDITCSYADGTHSFSGKSAVLKFLSEALTDPAIVTKHQCHHPEINFVSDVEAKGVWYLTDLVINPGSPDGDKPFPPITLQGTGFYEDRYIKVDGLWKIAHTGYERVYEEIVSREGLKVLSFKSRFQ